jgi:hypothetical protein
MNGPCKMLSVAIVALFVGGPLAGCKKTQAKEEPTPKEPPPDVRVDLWAHGLPKDFFRVDAETVLVQREMERGRSPLVSIPPFGRGFSRHRGLSIR